MGINICKIKVEETPPLPPYHSLKEGWLYKKSPLFEKYSKKWVVLSKNPNNSLFCFKNSKKIANECCMYIDFEQIEFKALPDHGLQFKDKKFTTNKWIFYSKTEEEFYIWNEQIKMLIKQKIKENFRNISDNIWTMIIIEEENTIDFTDQTKKEVV